jgi:nucleoside-diphosphate kinase
VDAVQESHREFGFVMRCAKKQFATHTKFIFGSCGRGIRWTIVVVHRSPLPLAAQRVRGYKLASHQSVNSKADVAMAVERTFSIIKPDAVARNLTGAINAMIEQAGLRIIAQKRVLITREQAETFYAVHRERPFFGELVTFMISGPVVVQVLEGDNAIVRYRDIMGATDPAKAAAGTIRKTHAKSIGENSVHGSDAADTAAKEIAQFFAGNEIVG